MSVNAHTEDIIEVYNGRVSVFAVFCDILKIVTIPSLSRNATVFDDYLSTLFVETFFLQRTY